MLFRFDEVWKAYGSTDVLKGVTFQVNAGERIGLVGRNGAGKSTIFKLLSGSETSDSGQVVRLSTLSVGLLEQHPRFEPGLTVFSAALSVFEELQRIESEMRRLEHEMAEHQSENDLLEKILEEYSTLQHTYEEDGGFTYRARAEEVLMGLGFKRDDFDTAVASLSGGQQGRLHLGMLLLRGPDVLLLDEPTNHLDLRAVEWLEEFLLTYPSAFVLISHDRFLLDRVTTRTVEISRGRATSFVGGFSEYIVKRDTEREIQQRHYERQQEEIAKTKDFIRRNLAGQKTKQAKSRRTMLERMDLIEAPETDAPSGNFKLNPIARSGEIVLTLSDLQVGYDRRAVAGPFDVTVRRGDRLGIVGPNGAGKTTLLKTLLGKLPQVAGDLIWGTGVKVGYYDQKLESLNLKNSIIGELQSLDLGATEFAIRSFLAQFLFRDDDVYKIVGTLSGGERGRLALAKLIYSQVNVLILDEPTNHLDIASCEALEAAIAAYSGTCLIVSHDRYFLDRVGTRMLYLEPGTSRLFEGTYSELWDARQAEGRAAKAGGEPVAFIHPVEAETANPDSKPAPVVQKKPARKNKAKLRALEAVEADITAAEAEQAAQTELMSTPDVASDPVRFAACQAEYERISTRLEALYAEWEDVAGEREAAAG